MESGYCSQRFNTLPLSHKRHCSKGHGERRYLQKKISDGRKETEMCLCRRLYILCLFFTSFIGCITNSYVILEDGLKEKYCNVFFFNFQIHFTVYQKEIESSAITEKSKNRISHLLFFCCCHNCSEF